MKVKKSNIIVIPNPFALICAEQNGALVTNRYNFSFGNGNEHNGFGINDWGVVIPKKWKLHSLTIGMRLTNTAPTAVRLTVNGIDTNAIVTAPGSTTKGIQDFTNSNYTGNIGDTLNFRTVSVGGGNDVVVSAFIELTI